MNSRSQVPICIRFRKPKALSTSIKRFSILLNSLILNHPTSKADYKPHSGRPTDPYSRLRGNRRCSTSTRRLGRRAGSTLGHPSGRGLAHFLRRRREHNRPNSTSVSSFLPTVRTRTRTPTSFLLIFPAVRRRPAVPPTALPRRHRHNPSENLPPSPYIQRPQRRPQFHKARR